MESTTDNNRGVPADRAEPQESEGTPPPYAPSWANRLTDGIERLPGPTWLAYLVVMAFGIGLTSISAGETGTLEPGPILYYGLLPFAILGLIRGSTDWPVRP